jgi:hypothetical protein
MIIRVAVMLFNPKYQERPDRLLEQLHRATALTHGLLSDVIAQTCPRLAAHSPTAKARINRLIASDAWIDAVLALIEIELPTWKLRRLIYEDGEWLCSLSKEPRLPLDIDEVAEASHETLPLAILLAFLEAQRVPEESAGRSTAVPQVRPSSGYAMCCDNFA